MLLGSLSSACVRYTVTVITRNEIEFFQSQSVNLSTIFPFLSFRCFFPFFSPGFLDRIFLKE